MCGEKAIRYFVRTKRLGITPAYAGKSREHCRGPVPSRDHPRMCGEKSVFCTATS